MLHNMLAVYSREVNVNTEQNRWRTRTPSALVRANILTRNYEKYHISRLSAFHIRLYRPLAAHSCTSLTSPVRARRSRSRWLTSDLRSTLQDTYRCSCHIGNAVF